MALMRPRTGTMVRIARNDDLSWCSCWKKDSLRKLGDQIQCTCGENFSQFDWHWDDTITLNNVSLSNNNRDILFHPVYSSGTGVIRGKKVFQPNLHHYWEIKMLSNLYGTDIMVGVGTKEVDLSDFRLQFCSVLGCSDSESWGYSYKGEIQHRGRKTSYGSRYGVGSIIGVHLDMCNGTLEFYLNRKPLGVAFTGLKNYKLYPMVCSTAAQSSMRITCAVSHKPTLEIECLKAIRKNKILVKEYMKIPNLQTIMFREYFWLAPQEFFEEPQLELEDEVVLHGRVEHSKRFCVSLVYCSDSDIPYEVTTRSHSHIQA